MSRLGLITAVVSILISAPAFGATVSKASIEHVNDVMIKEHFQVIGDLVHNEFKQKAAEAITVMVAQGTDLLDQRGFHDDARRFREQWKLVLPRLFDGVTDNIGDHEPLNAFLAIFYSTLRQRVGDEALRRYHLDDVNMINFTAPVVFQPAGDKRNGDTWDQAEYTRHFVPFAGIVTYWTSYFMCLQQVGTEDWAKVYCGRASLIFRSGMQSMVAPQLASAIYQHAHGRDDLGLHLNSRNLEEYYRAQLEALSRN